MSLPVHGAVGLRLRHHHGAAGPGRPGPWPARARPTMASTSTSIDSSTLRLRRDRCPLSNRPNPKKPSQARQKRVDDRARSTPPRPRAPPGRRATAPTWIIGGVAPSCWLALIVAVVVAQSGVVEQGRHRRRPTRPPCSRRWSAVSTTPPSPRSARAASTTLPDAPSPRRTSPRTASRSSSTSAPSTARSAPPQRWPMVQALSRFGTFSGLDAHPLVRRRRLPEHPDVHVPRGDLHQLGAWRSRGSRPQTVDRKPLDDADRRPGGADHHLRRAALRAEPRRRARSRSSTSAAATSSRGASYSPQVLPGMTADEVAAALSDPSSAVTQGIVGAANVITATICILTGDQPSNVCAQLGGAPPSRPRSRPRPRSS